MRAYKILPVEMKVKDFNLSKDALKGLVGWIGILVMGRMQRLPAATFLFPRVCSIDGYPGFLNFRYKGVLYANLLGKAE